MQTDERRRLSIHLISPVPAYCEYGMRVVNNQMFRREALGGGMIGKPPTYFQKKVYLEMNKMGNKEILAIMA